MPEPVDHLGRAENQACGDQLWLGLRVANGRVSAAGFRAHGCSSLLACAALVCEALAGMDLERARAMDVEALARAAGGPPPRGLHATAVVARALRAALPG
jgi:NifU-like protein involved in Fe-S cluster formation